MNLPAQSSPHAVHRPARPAGRALLSALFLIPGISHGQLPAGNWQFLWGDEFSGTALDGSKWNNGSPDWAMSTAAPTQIRQDHVTLGGGELTLKASRMSEGGAEPFAGGVISTYGKHNFNGVFIEARIWLPDTPGSWPALWGLYDGWPPEMDIMEYPLNTAAGGGYAADEYHTAFHYVNSGGGNSAGAGKVNPGNAGDLRGGYHTFSANWVEDSSVTFYFDGQQVSSFNSGGDVAEMASMYLMLNYAVGGWPGMPNTTEWPVGHTDQTKVDWIRVWTAGTSKTSNWTGSNTTNWLPWENGASWSNGEPNLGGATANFGNVAGAAEQNIDIIAGGNGARTLSVVNLDGGTRYRIGWPTDRLVLGFGNNGSIQPAIDVAASTTTEHEFWTQLEWSGNLGINNNSPGYPLLLTGPLPGGDGIAINGPGVVSFDGDNNTYSGRTFIDSGSAGPGVARARGQNSLGSGQIVIGENGNNTSGRLELENGALVPNEISLNGRNTATPGIVNNSGVNTVSGTIRSQTGGGNYWIQSDAGELVLSGASGGGVAINSLASGTRSFTLQGAGDGVVGGMIENGNATVNLAKSGTGTWTLDEANTYSGTTTVSQGTLEVSGSTGTGATTVNSGATLSGGGTVAANLTTQSGATARVGKPGFPLVSPSPFSLLDNFDSYAVGATTTATGGVWNGVFVGTGNSNIVASDGGLALQTKGGAAWRGAERDLTGTDAAVPVGETKTYFWQVKASSTGGAYDFMMGLSQSVAAIDDVDAWSDFNVMPFINNAASTPYINADGPTTPWWAPMNTGAWYNVWVVVNNDATAPTYDLYYSSGAGAPVLVAANAYWRNTGALPVGNALNAIGFMAAGGAGSEVLVDNIYHAPGSELQNPLDFVGAPLMPVAETLNVDGVFTLASGSTLELDVSTGALHDKLLVGGPFNAGGTLKVTLDPAQAGPVLGDSFDLFDSAGGTVNFGGFDFPALTDGLAWDTGAISTGVLSVVADATTYAGWVLTQSFDPGEDGPLFDVEPDGLVNAFEWLYGKNPLAADAGPFLASQTRDVSTGDYPAADPAKTYLTMTGTIRKNISGMTLIPQANSSLELLDDPGSAGFVFSRQVNDLADFEEREWIYTVPIEDSPTGFMRLKLIDE